MQLLKLRLKVLSKHSSVKTRLIALATPPIYLIPWKKCPVASECSCSFRWGTTSGCNYIYKLPLNIPHLVITLSGRPFAFRSDLLIYQILPTQANFSADSLILFSNGITEIVSPLQKNIQLMHAGRFAWYAYHDRGLVALPNSSNIAEAAELVIDSKLCRWFVTLSPSLPFGTCAQPICDSKYPLSYVGLAKSNTKY